MGSRARSNNLRLPVTFSTYLPFQSEPGQTPADRADGNFPYNLPPRLSPPSSQKQSALPLPVVAASSGSTTMMCMIIRKQAGVITNHRGM